MKNNRALNALEENPAAFAGAWLGIIATMLDEQFDEDARRAGLSADARLIPVYALIPTQGETTTAELSRALGCSHQLMKKRLDLLAGRKHLVRTGDAADARKTAVKLTAKGRKARAAVMTLAAKRANAVRAALKGPQGIRTEALPEIAARLRASLSR